MRQHKLEDAKVCSMAQVPHTPLADDAVQQIIANPIENQLEVSLLLILLGAYPFSLYFAVTPFSLARYILHAFLYVLQFSIFTWFTVVV